MNINATLLAQTIMLILFVWFCMKFIWPPLVHALADRKKHIADGLAAGERGKQELELATKRSVDILQDAKHKAAEIVAHAEKRQAEIIEEAKSAAKAEGDRIIAGAKAQIEQESFQAREALRTKVAGLVVAGAEKILQREVDAKVHADLLAGLEKQL